MIIYIYSNKKQGFEIPDEDGEFLITPKHVVQYVCDKYDVFEHDHGHGHGHGHGHEHH